MPTQARADATRSTILDAAAAVFGEIGYGSAGLMTVIDRADVTKGAFYYHFPTKSALAAALIEEADSIVKGVVRDIVDSPSSPPLENLIRATFATADILRRNPRVRVGLELGRSLRRVSAVGTAVFLSQRELCAQVVRNARTAGDVAADVDPDDAGQAIWAGWLGSQSHSDTTGEDIMVSLARFWGVILRGIASEASGPYLQQYLVRTAGQFTEAAL